MNEWWLLCFREPLLHRYHNSKLVITCATRLHIRRYFVDNKFWTKDLKKCIFFNYNFLFIWPLLLALRASILFISDSLRMSRTKTVLRFCISVLSRFFCIFKVINWFSLKNALIFVRLQRTRLSLVYLTFFDLLLILSDLLLRKLFVLSVTKNL